jgi:hypothetical protein
MTEHQLRLATAHQEQLRAEAADRRLASGRSTPVLRRILVAIATIVVGSSFGAPTLAPGAALPATH